VSSLPPFLRGNRGRLLLGTVAGLVVTGVVIGLILAWLSTTVLKAAGLDTSKSSPEPTAAEPTGTGSPPTTPEAADPTTTTAPPPTTSATEPTLTASPSRVGVYDEISLSGTFPRLAPGTPLQIERRVGGGAWALFPVSLDSEAGGQFSTIVQTGQSGQNMFRVTVPTTGLTTPVAGVRVG
jgi:hypothetical protein